MADIRGLDEIDAALMRVQDAMQAHGWSPGQAAGYFACCAGLLAAKSTKDGAERYAMIRGLFVLIVDQSGVSVEALNLSLPSDDRFLARKILDELEAKAN